MSDQICINCNKLLNDGDLVKAFIISRFVGLKSKAIYALQRPKECKELHHFCCDDPKGIDYDSID